MVLVIDVGNTRIKAAVFEKNTLGESFAFSVADVKQQLQEILKNYPTQLYKIPLYSEHIRSLNLANAVSIVVYEGLRNLK